MSQPPTPEELNVLLTKLAVGLLALLVCFALAR